MALDRRLAALRALVHRLERLPPSPRREWMLTEARARIVDVETGFTPKDMRPLEPEPPAAPPASSQSPAANGGGERPRTKAVSRKPPPEQPQPPDPASPGLAETGSGDSSTTAPEPDSSAAVLGTDGLLWLEDHGDDATPEPGTGTTTAAPWRRGLRG